MNNHMPRTPLSTHLSRSARETEIRIRNIFSGPKKRPPVPLMILVAAVCIFCGNLVSCHVRPAQPAIVMETQYYDSYANYLEIPMLALPAGEKNEAVDAINAGLAELGEHYDFVKTNLGVSSRCVLYPSTTDRYINLVFFEDTSDYGSEGSVETWVYDKKEGAQVTGEEALALAGTTREALFSELEQLITADPEDPRRMYPETPDPIVLLGFRVKADGKPVFYLSAFVDGRELENGGYLDEWVRLYIWDEGEFSRYSWAIWAEGMRPLVPAEETDKMDPPLWNQWYFAGEEPEGGFVSRYTPGTDPYGEIHHGGGLFPSTILDQYLSYTEEWNVFYAEYSSGQEKDGDLRVGPAVYLGEIPWGEDTYAAVYDVYYTFYHNTLYAGSVWGFDWDVNREMLVLSRSAQDGSFTGLLGRADYNYQMEDMTAEEIIRQIVEE